jgi:hypothetical protein
MLSHQGQYGGNSNVSPDEDDRASLENINSHSVDVGNVPHTNPSDDSRAMLKNVGVQPSPDVADCLKRF